MKLSKNLLSYTGKTILLSGVALASCNSSNQQSEQQQSQNKDSIQQPNIVMFFTDDNAFWYWGFGGGPKLSPTIDQIGEDGVEATQFYCVSSVSTPSRYNLHTGKYAGRCQSKGFLEENPTDEIYAINWNTDLYDSNETTMGQIFQQGGYTTAFVGKWHLGWDRSKFNFDPDADPANPEVDKKLKEYQQYIQGVIKENGFDYAASITHGNNDMHPVKALQHHNLEWYAKGAIDFLKQQKNNDKPFFLIVNITTHHGPCHRESLKQPVKVTQAGYVDGLEGIMPPRESVFERIKEKGYEVDFKTTGTLWTDDLVEAVLDELKNQGLENNTSVVFTTDHNRYDGKATCYQGGVHIPFLMKYPGIIEPGSKCDTRFQITDLFPTFMDMCGIDMPQELNIDGHSFWPALKGEQQKEKHETLYFEFGYTRAILDGDYKYIALRFPDSLLQNMKQGKVDKAYSYTGKMGQYPNALRYPDYFQPEHLYNIKQDKQEQNNLANDPQYQDKLKELKDKLNSYLKTFDHPFPLYEVDEFYYSDEYKKMSKKARNETNMEKYYWYRHECY